MLIKAFIYRLKQHIGSVRCVGPTISKYPWTWPSMHIGRWAWLDCVKALWPNACNHRMLSSIGRSA